MRNSWQHDRRRCRRRHRTIQIFPILSWLLLSLATTVSSSSSGGGNGGGPPPPPSASWDYGHSNDNVNDDASDVPYNNYDYQYQRQEPQEGEEYSYQQSQQQRRPPPPRPPGAPRDNDYNYNDSVEQQQEQQQEPYQYEQQADSQYKAWQGDQQLPRPPPRPYFPSNDGREIPPPPPSTTATTATTSTASRIPIHYEFPIKASTTGSDDINNPEDEEGRESNDRASWSPSDDAANGDTLTSSSSSPSVALPRASPRKDLITRYMSTTSGKLKVYASSTVVGASTGVFLAKSILPFGTFFWASVGGLSCTLSSMVLRTPLGELTRAVALSLVLVAQRTQSIRKQYPTWRYIPGALFQYNANNNNNNGPRRRRRPPPFPPARNPWTYSPQRPNDVEFNMMYSIIAMALVGSTCGGNLPMIPTWMGSLAGASLFALGCTLTNSPRGDLCRTMGMRVVALVQELWDIQAQLKIIPKAAIVSSQIIDRLLILDRQHRVKDRFLQLVNTGYEQAMKTASRVQQQRLEEQGRTIPSSNTGFRRRPPSSIGNQQQQHQQRQRPRDYKGDDYDDVDRDQSGRDYNDSYDKSTSRYRETVTSRRTNDDRRGGPSNQQFKDKEDVSSSEWDRRGRHRRRSDSTNNGEIKDYQDNYETDTKDETDNGPKPAPSRGWFRR